ncbi:uncharacterized protein LOC114351490 [Ostrinia furnacalis]|uniref:uncharacterized protein LOC114351490 n=1 Tax=Ostrinia furnacalis TaxID=93504 RepID=UPI00103A02E9|nr:uncharacterized protein LOC114351490 [Ostrinia furnacalis]
MASSSKKRCYKGAADIEKHINTEKHKKQSRLCASTSKLDNFVSMQGKDKNSAVDATLAFHVVKHHQSYKSMDCTSPLLKKLFSDSELARSLACARTKSEAIINNVIAPYSIEMLLQKLQDIVFFGCSTNASNHNAEKIFPIIIPFFDRKTGIQSKLIELSALANETSMTIANHLLTTLQKYNLKQKCVSFTGDNANVNFGGAARNVGNNVITHLNNNADHEIVGVGCPAHILHNAIRHATDLLDFDVESLVMKIFNHFSVCTVRTENLKELCNYVEINYEKLLCHSKTRWLSLFPAIERILELYEALKEYFLTGDKSPVIIKKFFESDTSEIYLFYLHLLTAIFHSRIATLEKEKNSIAEVLCTLKETIESLSQRIEHNFIPLKVRDLFHKNNINDDERNRINTEMKNLYQECINYINIWIKPLDSFKCFEWMTLQQNQELQFDNITESLLFLRNKGITIDDVKLFEEFCILQNFLSSKQHDFYVEQAEKKWVIFFEACNDITRVTELLKICPRKRTKMPTEKARSVLGFDPVTLPIDFNFNDIEDIFEVYDYLTPDDARTILRLYWQQEGAPPHFAGQVRDYLDEQFGDRWIGRGGPIHDHFALQT